VRVWAEPKSDWGQIFQAPVDLTSKDELDRWFYTPSWHRVALPAAPPEAGGGPWLALTESEGLGPRLVERLRAAGHEVVTVAPGTAYERRGDDAYTVAAGDAEGYRRLLGELRETGRRPAAVLHLRCLADGDAAASPWSTAAFRSFSHGPVGRPISTRRSPSTRYFSNRSRCSSMSAASKW